MTAIIAWPTFHASVFTCWKVPKAGDSEQPEAACVDFDLFANSMKIPAVRFTERYLSYLLWYSREGSKMWTPSGANVLVRIAAPPG